MKSSFIKDDRIILLRDELQLGLDDASAPKILNSTNDPTSAATDAEIGSLLLNRTSSNVFKKTDTGSTTNWDKVGVTDRVTASATLAAFGITAGEWGNLTSISVPLGEWDISCIVGYRSNGTTTTGEVNAGISVTTGNSATGLVIGDTRAARMMDNTNGNLINLVVPTVFADLGSTTTYFLKARALVDTGSLEVAFRITAIRRF